MGFNRCPNGIQRSPNRKNPVRSVGARLPGRVTGNPAEPGDIPVEVALPGAHRAYRVNPVIPGGHRANDPPPKTHQPRNP